MKLIHLLRPWQTTLDGNYEVFGVQNDSRQVGSGDLFLAYPGAVADGRMFIGKAVAAGAAAIAYDPENMPASVVLPKTVPCIAVPQLAQNLAQIAQIFYEHPSRSLNITGVTGTNGKTTIAYQLAQAHQLLGQDAAYIGTIGHGNVNHLEPLINTTPDALFLQKIVSQYLMQGSKQVCMEVSSHALSQNRVDGIEFHQAIFTNLTLDHLDYHHTMQEYAKAKALLFRRPELQYAIINQDDAYQELISQELDPRVKKLTYGLNANADVQAVSWRMDMHGTEIEVRSPWGNHQITIQALGQFNIYNSLALFSSLLAQNYPPQQLVDVMSQLKPAPGRMELVAQAPCVLVDYAHTPDALENALATLHHLKKAQLWVVFGCGGDRDKSKRPLMGKVASKYADHVLITSDNPRTEDAQSIVDDIAQGITASGQTTTILNREEAIIFALNHAAKNDIILIAGKGHESYQQIGMIKHPFSDQEVVSRELIAIK